MKKALILLTALVSILSLAGCAGKMAPNTVYSANDMTGRKVGVVKNTPATVYADGHGGTLFPYDSAETMLVELKNGAVDCAVMDESTAKATIKKVAGLKIQSPPMVKADFCFAIAKENPDLTKAVNAALKTLKDSGTLQKIIDGYKLGNDFRYKSPDNADLSQGTLTLAVDGKFPPYSYDDGKGNTVGIDIDIARAVCDILHVQMKISIVNKTDGNLLKTVQFGKADFSLGGLAKNEEDLKLVDFSAPYDKTTQVIVTRR